MAARQRRSLVGRTSGVLSSPGAWQVLDALIGLTMLALAAKPAVG